MSPRTKSAIAAAAHRRGQGKPPRNRIRSDKRDQNHKPLVIIIPPIEIPDLRAERVANLEKAIYECEMRCYDFINQSVAALNQLEVHNRALIERGAKKVRLNVSDRMSDRLLKHVDSCGGIIKALAASQLGHSSYYKEPPPVLPPAEANDQTIEMRQTVGYVPGNPTEADWTRESKHGEKIAINALPLASRKEQ